MSKVGSVSTLWGFVDLIFIFSSWVIDILYIYSNNTDSNGYGIYCVVIF